MSTRFCPNCGHEVLPRPVGRPKHLNDQLVLRLKEKFKWSYSRIAQHFGVSKGAIQGALIRAVYENRKAFLKKCKKKKRPS